MNDQLKKRILSALQGAGRRGMRFSELSRRCFISRQLETQFRACLRVLEQEKKITDTRYMLYHNEAAGIREAVVTRLNRTFGFVRLCDTEEEMFVPGKFFMGAMLGDRVMVAPLPSRGTSPEGEVVRILETAHASFTGTFLIEDGMPMVQPDTMIKFPLKIAPHDTNGAKEGDKILCVVIKRGKSHSDHIARVLQTYGDSQKASHCADAILDANEIKLSFPHLVTETADKLCARGITPLDEEGRTDLRHLPIFTIDSAESKDLDDAVSIERTESGYRLGVHIADVSHYVQPNTPLDTEAFRRGTSIYFADRVIPMLPPSLSNGICSLNPNEDRLAFSCFMDISADGQLCGWKFEKSIIRSRVKGVYKELNAILDGSASEELFKKYDGLTGDIALMKELADILTENKRRRGAPDIETRESYIILDENHVAIDITERSRGASEVMIEEFMLMANEAAASFAKENKLPFIFRVHEPPAEEKLSNLYTTLKALGQPCADIKPGLPAAALAEALRQAKGLSCEPLVNVLVLRSMSKAKYYEEPLGHYGLVLQNYAQFTSPIRRYPDLSIHRVLSDFLAGIPANLLWEKYGNFVKRSAKQSTETEIQAMTLERQCDDCYKAEYMKPRVGEEFDGYISSLAPHGIYVELANTVEGLIRMDALPEGEYDQNELISLKNLTTGDIYRIGDPIRIRCDKADVSTGKIDFSPVF